MKRILPLILLCGLALSGCSTVSYYAHVTKGQLALLNARVPISQVINDSDTPEALKQQLLTIEAARQFASESLLLPENKSYRQYADLQRPYAVWNVFAAEALSLKAKTHCFPVAGCVIYRGYFSEEKAEGAAGKLAQQGYDVHVGGAVAYSTLGWFSDPVLNTMLKWKDWAIVSLIFHELTHQKIYIKNDSAFNESLATAVAQIGLAQWLEENGNAGLVDEVSLSRERQQQFTALLLETRENLNNIYQQGREPAETLALKAAEIELLKTRYQQLKAEQWNGWAGYDNWFNKPVNNARLLPVATYNQGVPAFLNLFEECEQQWACFWEQAPSLATPPEDS